MRADRLVRMLLLLQNRGRLTARELASDLEVSLRTVFRDVEALGRAGVPVYGVRGPQGGFELLEGYRTELTGLSAPEAEALFLLGSRGPAAELGFSEVQAQAELKLMEGLPPAMRLRAAQLRDRFHHDPWAGHGPPVDPNLPRLSRAVWGQRVVEAVIADEGRSRGARLEPLALILKVGHWFLVARESDGVIVLPLERIEDVRVLAAHFERPETFDLADFWEGWLASMEEEIRPSTRAVGASVR